MACCSGCLLAALAVHLVAEVDSLEVSPQTLVPASPIYACEGADERCQGDALGRVAMLQLLHSRIRRWISRQPKQRALRRWIYALDNTLVSHHFARILGLPTAEYYACAHDAHELVDTLRSRHGVGGDADKAYVLKHNEGFGGHSVFVMDGGRDLLRNRSFTTMQLIRAVEKSACGARARAC
jgi:hypothetical protein